MKGSGGLYISYYYFINIVSLYSVFFSGRKIIYERLKVQQTKRVGSLAYGIHSLMRVCFSLVLLFNVTF
jgi:hypothetical protein